MRPLFHTLALLLVVAWTGSALAGDVRQNLGPDGLALKGYDPVAYQTEGAAVPGKAAFTATHDGATYRFASAGNRDAFAADPARYTPAFGGYCAMAMVFAKKVDTDPTAFRVVDGQLYLNFNQAVRDRWLQDVPGNIAKANANWSVVADKPASALQ
ncbi:MAG: YHS domain-containing protein [Alphaproteobacteria bacterium]|nr:YHS domain-containing protein [Alphaproteobacteria bacterium]MCB9931152.1 YHS domain-containing protein [Alphaproteobacteria bacterium]